MPRSARRSIAIAGLPLSIGAAGIPRVEKFRRAGLEIESRPPEPARCIPVLLHDQHFEEATMGRGILLWLLGVPIPVIILLWLFFGR